MILMRICWIHFMKVSDCRQESEPCRQACRWVRIVQLPLKALDPTRRSGRGVTDGREPDQSSQLPDFPDVVCGLSRHRHPRQMARFHEDTRNPRVSPDIAMQHKMNTTRTNPHEIERKRTSRCGPYPPTTLSFGIECAP